MANTMKLVIVESPTKARKLKSYLGDDFIVEASVGHIRDLPKSGLNIDLDNNFEPTYQLVPGKKKVLTTLRQAAAKAKQIVLATDPDREGEAIAWHVQSLLQDDKKLAKKPYKRAVFHEVTKQAVLKAIDDPGQISMDLVDAQQARRVVDRLVGYQVSPVLWKKIRRGLSAGRVQSVAVRLIVEREREIEAFVPDEYWELEVVLDTDKTSATKTKNDLFVDGSLQTEKLPSSAYLAQVVEVDGQKYQPTKSSQVEPVVAALKQAKYRVQDVERKKRQRWSPPPFTTSTLQQKAATTFGFSGKQTMRLAQQLYEEGLITYHRTDSVSLSTTAIEMARGYVKQQFGDKYVPAKPRRFSSKAKNAQEAHEAIRVTNLELESNQLASISGKFSARHSKLYDLIKRRFLASQMEQAVYDQTTVKTEFINQASTKQASTSQASAKQTSTRQASTKQTSAKQAKLIQKGLLRSTGSVLRFDGWLKLFPAKQDELLPDLSVDQEVDLLALNPQQKFTQPSPRYNDASLVKTLEEKGIGRPSTYASIISVIEDRGYVEKKDKRFYATAVGTTVTDFLMEYFTTFMDYEFTAEMEEDLDRIARGEKNWRKVVGVFYGPFSKTVTKVLEKAERKQIPVEQTGEPCPDCGKLENGKIEGGEIVIRTGRYGRFRSCSRFPDCKFSENHTQTVPDVKCPLCQKAEVVVKNTRWGKSFFGCGNYPTCDWASWKQPKPGETMTQQEWEEQQAQREARKKKRATKYSKKKGSKTTSSKTTKKSTKPASAKE